ncbi:MAG TPA: LysR family transcriptional regulator [Kofleriaceae bacterium]|nr:LysR family transcriptional regulator [Kofleriaceae bacterium]
MDLVDQMRTFVRVTEAGSLSAAARSRGLSLAAVSRQLAALEAELGTTLLVRTTRRLQITPSGERWRAHCVRLLRELEDARADVHDEARPSGSLVISAPITVGLELVAPRLERLSRDHPALQVELRLEDHVVDLVGEGVDLAVRGGLAPPDSAGVIAHPLRTFRRIAVASPGYLRRRGTPKQPRDLERHDGLVQHGLATTFTRWRFVRNATEVTVVPRVRLRSTTPLVLRDWALAGAGVALLPDWLVGDAAGLRPLLDGWQTPAIRIWALHRIELRGAPRIRAVLDALA